LRDIGRQGARWRPRNPNQPIVSPSSVRRKAVRLYHDEALSDALAYLSGRHPDGGRGLSGTFGPEGKRAKQGSEARESFARYVKLDGRDARPVAELGLTGDVDVGSHQVSTTIDVVVFAAEGYTGRVLNWDRGGLSDRLADMLSIPAMLLIDQELGDDTAVDVELWDLRNGSIWQVSREVALARADRLARFLDRIEAGLPI
jgi:hypothetical protein